MIGSTIDMNESIKRRNIPIDRVRFLFDSQEARMKSFAYAFAVALVAVSVLAQAQTPASYPSKPITIVVPYPAGGTSDNQVRIISEPLSKTLGQPVIVDNKSRASGSLGAAAGAPARSAGYTPPQPNHGR